MWHTVPSSVILGVVVDEKENRSTGEPARLPPPEWGREQSPVVGRLVTVAVVVVGIAAAVGLGVWGFDSIRADDEPTGVAEPTTVRQSAPTPTSRGANEADVGDCVQVVKGGVDAELAVVECGTPTAVYRVALELERGDDCPAGAYMEYSMIGFGGWSLCLALNATPGQCFTNDFAKGFASAECAAADFRVEAVLADTADGNACPPPPPNVPFWPKPLVYPTPPLTVCLSSIAK